MHPDVCDIRPCKASDMPQRPTRRDVEGGATRFDAFRPGSGRSSSAEPLTVTLNLLACTGTAFPYAAGALITLARGRQGREIRVGEGHGAQHVQGRSLRR